MKKAQTEGSLIGALTFSKALSRWTKLFIPILFFTLLYQPLFSQCPNTDNATCNMSANQYNNVVISEVSGDPGQSDGCNDAIVEIAGPPGTNIGCMVLTDTEWAVLIPPNAVIPADGVYVIACSEGNTNCGVGINGSSNGLITGSMEGDFNAGLTIDLDVCDPVNANFYDPAASGFTLDNAGSQSPNGDGEQVFMFLPDGTPWDGIYWDGGGSGNADHVSVSINGNDYTLGDNDGNGVVNDNAGTVPGGRGDGGNATAVPVLPTNMACPCNTPDAPGTFTVPAIGGANDNNGNGGPLWTAWTSSDHVGCNSSFIRLTPGTSAGGIGGSPSHMDGQVDDATVSSCGNNTDNGSGVGVDGDFGETTITSEGFNPNTFTPSACGDASMEWAYTDHPTPSEPNDDPTFVFYVDNDVLCDPAGMVTFTVEIYNWQHVSDNTDILSGDDNLQFGSLVQDPITGMNEPWDTYVVSGEMTTMTYQAGPFPGAGNFVFTTVWDDFSNCCGSSSSFGNECYESSDFTIKIIEPLMVTDAMIDCDAGDSPPGTINVNNFITGGSNLSFTLSDDAMVNPDETNSTGVFLIPTSMTAGPYTVTVTDGSGCSMPVMLTIADNCEEPPVCPSNLVNTGTTADASACPGDMVELCLDGVDLPAGGTICWYGTTDGTDPITTDATTATATIGTTATQLGCVDIPMSSVTPPMGGPVLNEVLYDPAGPDGSNACEAVEIAGTPGTDISCFMISDGDFVVVIPDGTTIPADGFYVIASGGCDGTDYPNSVIDLNTNTCMCTNGTGAAFNLTNTGEHMGFYDASGNLINGVIFEENSDGDNNGPNGQTPTIVNPAGCTNSGFTVPTVPDYDMPPSPWVYIGTNVVGASIELDTDITGNWQEDSDGGNTIGGTNAPVPGMGPDCFMYTIPDLCALSPATITIEPLISPIDPNCVDGNFNYVGPTSTFTVDCPEASIMPTSITGCTSDFPGGVMIPVSINGGTGNYDVEWALDGVSQGTVTISSGGNIVVPVPVMGKITLLGVTDNGGGMCIGSVNNEEACIDVLMPPTATITGSGDVVSCDPCDGTLTIAFTNIPDNGLDFEYTINGAGPFAGTASSSPVTLTGLCAGTYVLTSVEGSCVGMASGIATIDPPTGSPEVSVTTQPAAICNDGMVDVDLTAVAMMPAYSATTHCFFLVDPNTLPESAWPTAKLSSTTLSGITANTTVYVLYQDIPAPPGTGCHSVAQIMITVDASLCVTCTLNATCPMSTNLGSFNCNNLATIPACPTDLASAEAAPYNIDIVEADACGTILISCSDDATPMACTTTDQTITRTIRIVDDANMNGMEDMGEAFETCDFTITINPPAAPTVNCPMPMTTATCLTQMQIDDAFTAWLATASIGSTGCNPVLTNNAGTAPMACTGGSVTVTFTVTDDCTTATCDATFTVPASPAPSVNCPMPMTTATCLTQMQIDDAFTAWLATASVGGTGCNEILTNNAGTAPMACTGGSVTVTFTVTDDCTTATCDATFTVPASPAPSVNCPMPMTTAECLTQVQIDDAFTAWLATATLGGGSVDCSMADSPVVYIASSSNGDDGDGTTDECDIAEPNAEFVEICATEMCATCPEVAVDLSGWEIEDAASNDGSPATTIIITSGSLMPGECVTIFSGYLGTSNDPTGTEGSAFDIDSDRIGMGANCQVWNNGGDDIFLYDGDSQGGATLVDSESYSTDGLVNYAAPAAPGCPPPGSGMAGCNPILSNNAGAAPMACTGGSVTVTFTVTDDCTSVSCDATFTVPASPAPTLVCPMDLTLAECVTQDQIDDAYALWLASATAGGTGCNEVLTSNAGPAPLQCVGGSVTVTFTVTDDCTTLSCDATFTVPVSPAPTVVCPIDMTTSACPTQAEIDAAYATWLATASIGIGGTDCSAAPAALVYIASSDGTGDGSCTATGEFVEICATESCTNCPDEPVDLSGWRIDDTFTNGAPGNATGLIVSGSLMPGECVTIYSGLYDDNMIGTSQPVTGTEGSMFEIDSERDACPVWNSGGDVAFLTNAAGVLVDSEPTIGGVSTYSVPTLTGCPVPGDGPSGCNAVLTNNAGPAPEECVGGSVTVTFTVTDDCTSVSCDAIFTVPAPSAPMVTCPPDQVVTCFEDIDADPSLLTIVSDCDIVAAYAKQPLITGGIPGCDGVTYTYIYKVIDRCGNVGQCEQQFLIQNDPPIVTVPGDEVVDCFEDIEVSVNDVTVMADCPGDLIINVIPPDIAPDELNCPGVLTYTYRVKDFCNRVVEVERNFTIANNEEPTITAPANFVCECVGNANPGNAIVTTSCDNSVGYEVEVSDPVITGNPSCPGATVSYTYTVTDACGRTASDVQTITIDNAPPVLACPENCIIMNCSDGSNDDIIEAWIESVTGTASCGGGVTVTNNFNGNYGMCINNGYTPVTFTAIDECGRTASCEGMIVVIDTDAPIIYQDPTELLVPCNGVIEDIFDEWLATQGGAEAIDGCWGNDITWTTNPSNPTLNCAGGPQAIVVEFIATDGCGNSASTTGIFNTKIQPDMVNVSGQVHREDSEPVSDVQVGVMDSGNGIPNMDYTSNSGSYGIPDIEYEDNLTVTPEKDINPLNGITTADLILLQKHILIIETLDSPYKQIAADINRSGHISTMDLILLRRLILFIDTEFTANTSWRFVDADFVFPNPSNPFETAFPEIYELSGIEEDQADFIGVKIGDLNLSGSTNELMGETDDRSLLDDLVFEVKDQHLKTEEEYRIDFSVQNFDQIDGFQFTLNFEPSVIEFIDIESGDLFSFDNKNYGLNLIENGVITFSWNTNQATDLRPEEKAFTLRIRAKSNVQLSEAISITSQYTRAEAYQVSDLMNIELVFNNNGQIASSDKFRLFQNQPNPFKDATTIGFNLPEATTAQLLIYDISGRLVYSKEADYAKGYNQIDLSSADLPSGILYYHVITANNSDSKKMILLD